MASSLPVRNFPLGQKQVFLPNFTITLLRTPFLPPTYAKFIVPLNLNKLDLRDYLYHAYGIRVLRVRAFVEQQKVRQDRPGAKRPSERRWYRPRAIKRMTVEMERPFVWPEEPEDFSLWDKDTYDAAQGASEKQAEARMPDADQKTPDDAESLAEQARRLLEGKERWKPQTGAVSSALRERSSDFQIRGNRME